MGAYCAHTSTCKYNNIHITVYIDTIYIQFILLVYAIIKGGGTCQNPVEMVRFKRDTRFVPIEILQRGSSKNGHQNIPKQAARWCKTSLHQGFIPNWGSIHVNSMSFSLLFAPCHHFNHKSIRKKNISTCQKGTCCRTRCSTLDGEPAL